MHMSHVSQMSYMSHAYYVKALIYTCHTCHTIFVTRLLCEGFTVKTEEAWTPKIISGMFIVLRPIRFEMLPQQTAAVISKKVSILLSRNDFFVYIKSWDHHRLTNTLELLIFFYFRVEA